MDLTVNLVLGSKSPRRAQLLRDLGFTFSVLVTDADENAPESLTGAETAVWISEQKAKALQPLLNKGELGITSDTEVWLDQKRFGKAENAVHAREMLESLSGRVHEVITGLTLVSTEGMKSYTSSVSVEFSVIPSWAIDFYINEYQPFDKAGAYGIQEWIGQAYITKISGEYNAVVGLPTATLMEALLPYKK
ncbi:MAG: hypothetical protein RL754_244 [Bacteroidota bacterium]|jgi:septum formation protein